MNAPDDVFQTRCNECDRVLTDGGERLDTAIFDPLYPVKVMTEWIVFAHCESCYRQLVKKGGR